MNDENYFSRVFVRPELGSVISEDDHESSGPESDLLDCISVSIDDWGTGFTPNDGLNMFRFRCLGFNRNIGCMKETLVQGVKMRMERSVSRCGTGARPCAF